MDRIAQTPMEPRDSSKMLVLNRPRNTLNDRHVADLPDILEPGDLLVINDTRVFKARLSATVNGRPVEIFLLRPDHDEWLALAKPGRKLHEQDNVTFSNGTIATVISKYGDGTVRIKFGGQTANEIFALANKIGNIPTPPYVKAKLGDPEKYQTIYARETGSVAAPTAGFHFTNNLFERLRSNGINVTTVTLHVGLGTFRPIKTETLEEHVMHEEWTSVSNETVIAINKTRLNGHRVIAVGTTTVRALESAAAIENGFGQFSGFTNLFITPGYKFRVIDGLLTNFHLPKSTLLVLVSAFAGREYVLRAYQHAIDNGYRFYSFGDAMLIL